MNFLVERRAVPPSNAGGMHQQLHAQSDDLARVALAHSARGDHTLALRAIVQALATTENPSTRNAFVACVRAMQFFEDNATVRHLLLRALTQGWGRPEDLTLPAADMIKAAGTSLSCLAQDALLDTLLRVTPNQDPELEQHLSEGRKRLLQEPDAALLGFHCALAEQCFLNEYVFSLSDDERQDVARLSATLQTALEKDLAIAPSQVAALASYQPLTDARLLDRRWPPVLETLLTRQLREPAEERRLAQELLQLTPVTDPVSRRVARQYEENPYPRWVCAAPAAPAEAGFTDILVAGCGTGRNAIETARTFPAARVLAVDLSRGSLAHAVRKARQLEVANIEYAQADLLEMASLTRRFDLIEAIGVLHHLADPFGGWQALLQLLKPGGVMKLGLYSRTARTDIARARATTQGFPDSADGIRAARRHLRGQPEFSAVTQRPDFFTLSNCRDLLFHVQETCVTLDRIDEFLRRNKLTLLGFDLDAAVLARYRMRFPDDPGATDLGNWANVEAEQPSTFDGMYQFWIGQRAAA